MRDAALPSGFVRFIVDGSEVVCAESAVESIRHAMRAGTLYRYAAAHPRARTMRGRGVVFAAPLPLDAGDVVVRHNHHGGLFARLTRDLFRGDTRAPHELRISERLHRAGVPTPTILAVAIYPAMAGFKRSDVVTREVPNAYDLSVALMSADAERRGSAIRAAAELVRALSAAGAAHADLNVKNVLLRQTDDGAPEAILLDAIVLDVDRITFHEPGVALESNLARLLRSARKWQARHGACVTASELDELAGLVRERRPPPMPLSTSS
jgi:3-deoxy-D-manno-octulosonic acid kinase